MQCQVLVDLQNSKEQKGLVLVTEEFATTFLQSCEKRANQVAFIVSALIRQRCDRTN